MFLSFVCLKRIHPHGSISYQDLITFLAFHLAAHHLMLTCRKTQHHRSPGGWMDAALLVC